MRDGQWSPGECTRLGDFFDTAMLSQDVAENEGRKTHLKNGQSNATIPAGMAMLALYANLLSRGYRYNRRRGRNIIAA